MVDSLEQGVVLHSLSPGTLPVVLDIWKSLLHELPKGCRRESDVDSFALPTVKEVLEDTALADGAMGAYLVVFLQPVVVQRCVSPKTPLTLSPKHIHEC